MMCNNKFYSSSRCVIEIMNGINQDYFYLPFFTQPHEKSKGGKGQFKVTENPKWGSESLLHLPSILWLENILWLFRCHFVALSAKRLLSKIKKVDLVFREEETQKHSRGFSDMLRMWTHKGITWSKTQGLGIGMRSSLCSHSSLCYQNRAKAKTKKSA